MTIQTYQYRFSHGHSPRGEGYWGFQINWLKNKLGQRWPSQVWTNGSYSEAKAAALKEVKRCAGMGLMAQSVEVLP